MNQKNNNSSYEVCLDCPVHAAGEDDGPYAGMSHKCWQCPAADQEREQGFSQDCIDLRENYYIVALKRGDIEKAAKTYF
jgi:hypothetical protein